MSNDFFLGVLLGMVIGSTIIHLKWKKAFEEFVDWVIEEIHK